MNESEIAQPQVNRGWFMLAVRWLFRFSMWMLLLAFALSFFGRLFFVAELLSNFRFHFFLLFLVALLLTRFAKTSWLLFALLFLGTGFSGWETGRLYLPGNQPTAGETKIRLMSFNVLANNEQFDSAIGEIRKHDPDVVAVLEYANMWHVALNALNEQYPHQHREPRWHGYGIAIFSKLPLENPESISLTKNEIDNPSISVNVQVDGKQVRIMAVHVMSPIHAYRLELRNRQFLEIADLVKQESIPTILVGDMNCTTCSSFLSGMIKEAELRDSRQGFGLQSSWPSFAGPFAVPIDHVLVSDSIHVHNRFVGNACGSDHRPVIADLSIGPDQD